MRRRVRGWLILLTASCFYAVCLIISFERSPKDAGSRQVSTTPPSVASENTYEASYTPPAEEPHHNKSPLAAAPPALPPLSPRVLAPSQVVPLPRPQPLPHSHDATSSSAYPKIHSSGGGPSGGRHHHRSSKRRGHHSQQQQQQQQQQQRQQQQQASQAGQQDEDQRDQHISSSRAMPRTIAVLDASRVSHVSERFLCATLDWWPGDKCDYGRCPWAGGSMLDADLDDPLLVNAARALSPFYLRLGGSLSDFVTYEEAGGCAPLASAASAEEEAEAPAPTIATGSLAGGEQSRPCAPKCDGSFVRDQRLRVGFRGGCLSRQRWERLARFCNDVGCEIVLTINAMRGRHRAPCAGIDCRNTKPPPTCCTHYTGEWDERNAAAFLRYAAARSDPLAALAYGNELGGKLAIGAKLTPAEYAAGLATLRRIVRDAWRDASRAAPRVVGPNAQLDLDWLSGLLAADSDTELTTVTHHLYPLGAGSLETNELLGKVLRASFLDKLRAVAETARRAVTPPRELWVTEMGGAYNSGRPGVTDAFASTFWFADALGTLALHGTSVVCRQTLIGGHYGLLALGARADGRNASGAPPRGVSPDLWVARLWRQLVGPIAMAVDAVDSGAEGAGSGGVGPIRAYAACAAPHAAFPAGALTVVLINLHKSAREVDVSAVLTPRFVRVSDGDCANGGEPLVPTEALLDADGSSWGECSRRCLAEAKCTAFALVGLGSMRDCTLYGTQTAASALPFGSSPPATDLAQAPQVGCHVRSQPDEERAAIRQEWRLTASASLTSPLTSLNGAPLRAEVRRRGELPGLSPQSSAGAVIELDPRSVNFFVFPRAKASRCLQVAQAMTA